MALEAISCATQLDSFVVIDINGKEVTHDLGCKFQQSSCRILGYSRNSGNFDSNGNMITVVVRLLRKKY